MVKGISKILLPAESGGARLKPSPTLKRWLLDANKDMDIFISTIDDTTYDSTLLDRKLLFRETYTPPTISPVEKAVLALEDRRFFTHSGIDVFCIPRGFKRFLRRGRIGGISTIEQQLVRTLLNRRERTAARKLREMILAYVLTFRASKRNILVSYLTLAYLIYKLRGVDQASRLLYKLDARHLNNEQASLVATLFLLLLPRAVIESIKAVQDLKPIPTDKLLEIIEKTSPTYFKRMAIRSDLCLKLLSDPKQAFHKINV